MTHPAAERVVVFLRHGHTEWNRTERFTGWTDIDLSEEGTSEAVDAGRRLAEAGYRFDEAHVSVLRRTRQTAEALLRAAGQAEVSIHESWRLNERHYGALQGLHKPEIFAAWGEERARRWWRGYAEPPPALARDDPRHPRFDALYSTLDPAELPAAESLSDCQRRVLPYWQGEVVPRLRAGRRLLIVSHGNTLRSLVMHLEQIGPEAMEHLEIASGVPLVYRFSAGLEVLGRAWLE